MAKVRSLFDATRPIDRRIERVIQYRSSDEELLKREGIQIERSHFLRGAKRIWFRPSLFADSAVYLLRR